MITAIMLNMLRITGFTQAIAPWEAKIKFSMFPKTINTRKKKKTLRTYTRIIIIKYALKL